jgi:predicted ATPase
MGRLESSKRNVARGRFIGRARELEGLAEKARPGTVVTVVGPPGVGKTRLAREFARSEADRREVLLCDFSEASTDEEVVTVLVRALGADVAASASYDAVLATIGRALSGKDGLLLLLDNFEHLTRFSGLVRRSAELGPALLVTSREPLAIPGEVVFELAPLLAASDGPPAGGADSPATQLFLDCFRMQNPGWSPNEAELEVVRPLTARLEGLPLSIVLAASALKPPITPDLRELPASIGQSLEETIEVSWNLLHPDEQRALAECSMFRGSFEERPASQVLSRADGAPVDAYALLHGLAKKSLLSIQYVGPTAAVERGPGDSDRPSLLGMRRRFQMLASIRDFASKRLAALGDEPTTDPRGPTRAHRFAQAYAALAREAAEIEMGLDAREAKDLLEHDVDNLSLAHRLAVERGLAEPAVEVALGIALVISGRAPLTRTLSLLDAAIAAADGAMESLVAVRA